MIKRLLFICSCFLSTFALQSQNTLTLEQCLTIAKDNSNEAKQALNDLKAAYYDYKLYRANFYPSLSLSGTIPSFNRSISKITMPDGSEAFIAQSVGSYAAELSFSQPIPWTGGNIYLSSGLQRLDLYSQNKTTSFLATPINIGLRQPLFAYNAYRWQKKTEPLRYEENKVRYAETIESLNADVITAYFNCLTAQKVQQITKTNLANSDTLLQIVRDKFTLGKCTEDEVLQLEVNNLNLQIAIMEKTNTFSYNLETLSNILKTEIDTTFILAEPQQLSLNYINNEEAYSKALENGSNELTGKRQHIEAESNLDRAKKDNGISFNINTTLGISNTDNTLPNAYKNLLDQEIITLSLSIPIVDFGKRKYQRRKAELELLNTNLTIEDRKLQTKQTVYKLIDDFNVRSLQLNTISKSLELNNKRYSITRERFINGKINFIEYSNAEQERDNADLEALRLMQNRWVLYYQIRKATLFDFLQQLNIKNEVEL